MRALPSPLPCSSQARCAEAKRPGLCDGACGCFWGVPRVPHAGLAAVRASRRRRWQTPARRSMRSTGRRWVPTSPGHVVPRGCCLAESMSRPRAQVGIVNPGHRERGCSAGSSRAAASWSADPQNTCRRLPPPSPDPGPARSHSSQEVHTRDSRLPALGSCPFPGRAPLRPQLPGEGPTGDFLEAEDVRGGTQPASLPPPGKPSLGRTSFC